MTNTIKRADQLVADQAMIDGIQKAFAQASTLTFGSQTLAPAVLVKIFQDRIAAGKAAQAADAARTAAIKADRDERATTGKTVLAFRRFVLATFTESPDTLAVFGLKGPKPPKTTAAVKAQAQTKSKATRKARNTMGKKQKKAITGQTATAGTPAPTPPAPAPPKAGGLA